MYNAKYPSCRGKASTGAKRRCRCNVAMVFVPSGNKHSSCFGSTLFNFKLRCRWFVRYSVRSIDIQYISLKMTWDAWQISWVSSGIGHTKCEKPFPIDRGKWHALGSRSSSNRRALFQSQRDTCSMVKWHYCTTVLDIFFAVPENIMMSSKYTGANCHLSGDKMTSVVRWNVPGSLHNLNGMQENQYDPLCEVNAVLFRSASSIFTCHWLQLAGSVENINASASESKHSFIRDMG